MNRNTLQWCFVVVVAVASLACGAGCGLIEKPGVSVTGANIRDVSLTDATLLFDVKVDNPYTVPLPIGNLDYILSSHGLQFLTGTADLRGTVPAGGSKTLPLPVKINFLKLIKAVKDARPGSTIPYKADMGLSMDTPVLGKIRVPMSKEGEISIPSAPALLDKLKDLAK